MCCRSHHTGEEEYRLYTACITKLKQKIKIKKTQKHLIKCTYAEKVSKWIYLNCSQGHNLIHKCEAVLVKNTFGAK